MLNHCFKIRGSLKQFSHAHMCIDEAALTVTPVYTGCREIPSQRVMGDTIHSPCSVENDSAEATVKYTDHI